jgi:hypothetical protein
LQPRTGQIYLTSIAVMSLRNSPWPHSIRSMQSPPTTHPLLACTSAWMT